jgi:hypothetical protein
MTPLYLINSLAYLGSAAVILYAIGKVDSGYRLLFTLPFLTCLYYGGVYLAVITGVLCESEIADWTRRLSSLLPVQLALIVLIVVGLLRGAKHADK